MCISDGVYTVWRGGVWCSSWLEPPQGVAELSVCGVSTGAKFSYCSWL